MFLFQGVFDMKFENRSPSSKYPAALEFLICPNWIRIHNLPHSKGVRKPLHIGRLRLYAHQ
jgi:hypothetical protein